MKVTAFNGSAPKTAIPVFSSIMLSGNWKKQGLKPSCLTLQVKRSEAVRRATNVLKIKIKQCSVKNDVVNECIGKMIESDGIILGSPTYFADVTTELKALIDRAGLVSMANGGLYKRKVGAAIVAMRRGGGVHVFDSINHFFFINQMIVPGSSYWNLGIGREKGEVEKDEEGIRTMKVLGENMAWLLKKIHG